MARSELRTNIKFKRLLRRLDLPAPYVLGLLELMWQVGYQSGSDLLGSPEDVELAAEWSGKPTEFFEAIRADWLDERSGKYYIHDLYDHAPEYVKKKMSRRLLLSNKDLQQKTADKIRQCPPNVGSTQPNPTQPNPTESSTARAVTTAKKKKPPNPHHRELVEFFCERWKARHGEDYAFAAGRDGMHISWILSNCRDDVGKAKGIIRRFFDDPDPWIAGKGHSLGLLVSSFNRYRIAEKNGTPPLTKARVFE